MKRKPGNFDNYIEESDGTYRCKDCDAVILSATVTHPVHWSMMPGSGFGEVETRQVPYCPNCEEKPNPNGQPVYYEF